MESFANKSIFYVFWLCCDDKKLFPSLQDYIVCFFIPPDIFTVSLVAFTFLIHLECTYVLGQFLAPLPEDNYQVLPGNLH